MGHVGSKTRSLGQILEKLCVRSIFLIFGPILMKLIQNICLDEISDNVEIRSCGVKKLGQILEKHCVSSRGHIFCPILMKLGQNVYLDEMSDK